MKFRWPWVSRKRLDESDRSLRRWIMNNSALRTEVVILRRRNEALSRKQTWREAIHVEASDQPAFRAVGISVDIPALSYIQFIDPLRLQASKADVAEFVKKHWMAKIDEIKPETCRKIDEQIHNLKET